MVRFGVLNSMHPDVRKIAPQNLKTSTPISPLINSNPDLIKLYTEKKKFEEEIELLRKSDKLVDKEKMKDIERRLKAITDALEKKGHTASVESDCIKDIMTNARIVCSTLSSCINLKQYENCIVFVNFNIVKLNVNIFRYIAKFDVCFIDEASQCTGFYLLTSNLFFIALLLHYMRNFFFQNRGHWFRYSIISHP